MADRTSFERSSVEIPTSPIAPPAPEAHETHESPVTREADPAYDHVVQSDIGINTLLNRLKQSVAAARDFAVFLKKRSAVEEEHAQSLKKLSRTSAESIRRPDSRQGSFLRGYDEVNRVQERMADNGIQFALSLHQMHEDLQELAAHKELGRKEWKHKGLLWEKQVADAHGAMNKAKSKYNSLAEDYDRARTGERQTGRFGLKGPKSAAQAEEDLHRRMQAADTEYASRVQTAQQLQQELVASLRPQAIKSIEDLIHECDAGLSLQMQKFATFHEKLLLSNGLCINPVRGEGTGQSLREIVQSIDNEKDLKIYVSGFANQALQRQNTLKYEPHHTLQSQNQAMTQPPPHMQQQFQGGGPGFPPQNQRDGQPMYPGQIPPQQMQGQMPNQMQNPMHNPLLNPMQNQMSNQVPNQMPPQMPNQMLNQSQPQIPPQRGPNGFQQQQQQPMQSPSTPTAYGHGGSTNSLPYHEGQPGNYPNQQQFPPSGLRDNGDYGIHNAPPPHPVQQQPYSPVPSTPYVAPTPHAPSPGGPNAPAHSNGSPVIAKQAEPDLPPIKPVFGHTLEDLFARDGSAVPMVVYQCLQAVDLFGLEVEGIYRTSGNAVHIAKLRSLFDNDSSQVDFRNPEAFYHDVNSVAGVLKQFFRDLPDPLFTREHYQGFIDAARIDDDVSRRDSLHAEINNLPDPNYATLRALTLHLHRVQEHSGGNRMNAGNLAICFGPTLMVGSGVPAIADAGWQVRAVDTILQNAYSIFDED